MDENTVDTIDIEDQIQSSTEENIGEVKVKEIIPSLSIKVKDKSKDIDKIKWKQWANYGRRGPSSRS